MALSRQDLTLMPCNLFLSALLPDYPLGCKRVAYDAGWLKSLHRPNVDLNRSKIVKATPRGLCTEDGREHAFDVIIFATVRLLSPFLGLRAELINFFPGLQRGRAWRRRQYRSPRRTRRRATRALAFMGRSQGLLGNRCTGCEDRSKTMRWTWISDSFALLLPRPVSKLFDHPGSKRDRRQLGLYDRRKDRTQYFAD